jgi:hypothetical protein
LGIWGGLKTRIFDWFDMPSFCHSTNLKQLFSAYRRRWGPRVQYDTYKPSFPALFPETNSHPECTAATICTLRCPVCFMIDRSEAPAIAALVA